MTFVSFPTCINMPDPDKSLVEIAVNAAMNQINDKAINYGAVWDSSLIMYSRGGIVTPDEYTPDRKAEAQVALNECCTIIHFLGEVLSFSFSCEFRVFEAAVIENGITKVFCRHNLATTRYYLVFIRRMLYGALRNEHREFF